MKPKNRLRLVTVIFVLALVPGTLALTSQVRKPTAFTDNEGQTIAGSSAYDGTGFEDSTSATTSEFDKDPSVTFSTWNTTGKVSYLTMDLEVTVSSSNFNSDSWAIYFDNTTDTTCDSTDRVLKAPGSENANKANYTAELPATQNLNNLQVCLSGFKGTGQPDRSSQVKIFDIRTDGKYDTTPPEYRNQGQNSSYITGGEAVKLYAEARDNYNLSFAELATNETGSLQNTTSYGSPQNVYTDTFTWTNFTWNNPSISNNVLKWRLWYNDTSSNYRKTSTRTFVVDSQEPAVNIVRPPNSTLVTSSPSLEVTADEPIVDWKYNLDASGNTSFQPNETLSVSDGFHHLKVWAVDRAGNARLSERYFSTDTEPPVFSNRKEKHSSPAVYSEGKSYQFNVTVTDDNLQDVTFEFDGQNYTVSSSGDEYFVNIDSLAAGTYSYRWYASDTLGQSNATEYFNYQVEKAPVETSLLLNGTRGDRTYSYGSAANLTAGLNVSDTVELWTDFTGSLQQRNTGNAPLQDIAGLDLSLGSYTVRGVFFQDTNYTADNETHLLEIFDSTAPEPLSSSDDEAGRAFKGEKLGLRTKWRDNYQLDAGILSVNTSGSYTNVSDTKTSAGWANFSYTLPKDRSPGVLGWRQYANDTSSNYGGTQVFEQEFWGYSETLAELNTTSVKVGEAVRASCRSFDSNSSSGIGSYTVEVYNDTVKVDSGTSSASGWYNTTLAFSSSQDQVPVRCVIYDDPGKRYEAVFNGSKDLTVNLGEPPKLDSSIYGINDTRLTVGEKLKAYAKWNETLNFSYSEYDTTVSGDYTKDYRKAPFANGWTNFSIDTGVTWFKGEHSVKIYANNSVGSLNNTLQRLNFDIVGYSEVNFTGPGEEAARGVTELEAEVTDANTSEAVDGYQVEFWFNGSRIGTNTTNSTGDAVYYSDTTSQDVGEKTVEVNITDSSYYLADVSSDTGSFNLTGELSADIISPGGIIHRGEPVSLTGEVYNDQDETVAVDSAIWLNSTEDKIGTSKSDSWTPGGYYGLGKEEIRFNASRQLHGFDLASVNVTIFGYARIESANLTSDRIREDETTVFKCRVGAKNNPNYIADYPVRFENGTNQVVGKVNTNATGWASLDITDPSVGNETYSCFIRDNETLKFNSSNEAVDASKTLHTLDTTEPNYTVQEPLDKGGFKKSSRDFNATWEDNFELDTARYSFNDTGSFSNQSISLSGVDDFADYGFTNTSFEGVLGHRFYGTDSYGNVNATDYRDFKVYGGSDLYKMELSSDKISPGKSVDVTCGVEDNLTSEKLANYQVELHNGTVLVDTRQTDSNGIATFSYIRNQETTDDLECRIADAPSRYYLTDTSSLTQTVRFQFGDRKENLTAVKKVGRGDLLGGKAELENLDANKLDWREINASKTALSDYLLVNVSTEIPPYAVRGVDYQWNLEKLVRNFVHSINDPGGDGTITFSNGNPSSTYFTDTEAAQITEAKQGNRYQLDKKGFNYYLPETETEVTYSELEFNARVRGDGTEGLAIHWNNFATGGEEKCAETTTSSYVNVTCSLTDQATVSDVISTDRVYIAFNDTLRSNGETQTTWEIDQSYITAKYRNPSTGNVYNYSIGYRDQDTRNLNSIRPFNPSGQKEFHSGNSTAPQSSLVSEEGLTTGLLSFYKSGTANTQAYREHRFLVDRFLAKVRYEVSKVKDYSVEVTNSTGSRVRGVNFTVRDSGQVVDSFSSFDSGFTDELAKNQNYTVEQSLPVDGRQYNVTFHDWNVSKTVRPDTQFVNYSSLDEDFYLWNASQVYAVDDSNMDYSKATIKVPKRKGSPNIILHCTDYDFENSECGSWNINDTTDYPHRETQDYFVFNVTGFDAFGTAQGAPLPNVTEIEIYNVTGLGLSQKETGGTLLDSGLNKTFDIDQFERTKSYRFQFHIVNDGTKDWPVANGDEIFHDGLNSTWSVGKKWYNISGTQYVGGTFSGTSLSWDTSQGGTLQKQKDRDDMYAKYIVNVTTEKSRSYQEQFKVNDTSENQGSFDYHIFNITKYGFLELDILEPPAEVVVSQNRFFTLNTSLTCQEGLCGDVKVSSRYNQSAVPDTLIPEGSGQPFHTNQSNTVTCGTGFRDGDSCFKSWQVNATGPLGEVRLLDANASTDLSKVESNSSENVEVYIRLAALLDVKWDTVDFGLLDPGVENRSAQGNSNSKYNLTVDENSLDIDDIWVKSEDLTTGGWGNYSIYAENVSYSQDNDVSKGTGLSNSYQHLASNVKAGSNLTTYYWIDVPEGIKSDGYNGTISFKANVTR